IDTLMRAMDASTTEPRGGFAQEDLDRNGTTDVVLHATSVPAMQDGAHPLRTANGPGNPGASVRFSDLNLDGVMDMITVTPDGRVVVSKAP
ncbi:MAG TPA: hypothetical protein VKG92_05065, partial [Flavobacteriales bacterium]|nr:hypothetical protein [Flavobacteriales bacterium]